MGIYSVWIVFLLLRKPVESTLTVGLFSNSSKFINRILLFSTSLFISLFSNSLFSLNISSLNVSNPSTKLFITVMLINSLILLFTSISGLFSL